MKYKQQNQTKKFFEIDAKNWSRKSDFKENLIKSHEDKHPHTSNQIIRHEK